MKPLSEEGNTTKNNYDLKWLRTRTSKDDLTYYNSTRDQVGSRHPLLKHRTPLVREAAGLHCVIGKWGLWVQKQMKLLG